MGESAVNRNSVNLSSLPGRGRNGPEAGGMGLNGPQNALNRDLSGHRAGVAVAKR